MGLREPRAEFGQSIEDSITQAELDRIECCVGAVRNHKAVKLLRKKGQCEVVIVAEYRGILIKARLDKLIESPAIIVDAKKVAAPSSPGWAMVSEEKFCKSIVDYMYTVQMGLYRWIVKETFKVVPQFWWLVVEDDIPNSVAVYKPCKRTMIAANNHFMHLLNRVVDCREKDDWPGIGQDVIEISAPNRYLKLYGQD